MYSLFGSNICFLQTPIKFLLQFKNISYLAVMFIVSHLWSPWYPLFHTHICFLQIPMKCLLQFLNILHLSAHLHIPFLADIFLFFVFLPITFETVHSVTLQNTNAHEVLGDSPKYFIFVLSSFRWQPKIFFICKQYFFLDLYDLLGILCLAVIFVCFFFWQTPMKVLQHFIIILHFQPFFPSHLWSPWYSLFPSHICFLEMPMKFYYSS